MCVSVLAVLIIAVDSVVVVDCCTLSIKVLSSSYNTPQQFIIMMSISSSSFLSFTKYLFSNNDLVKMSATIPFVEQYDKLTVPACTASLIKMMSNIDSYVKLNFLP